MNRNEAIDRLTKEDVWDIIIIGGGASGLGAAVDAASRGYSCLLLEAFDFAKGTSSRSTKLVHGGVRYLAQGDVMMVMDALEERGILMKNAPHLVSNQLFVVPNYEWWAAAFYTIGLKVYDYMAGRLGIGPSEYIDKEEVESMFPNLNKEDLRSGVMYYDGQFDDSRLAINLAQTAWEHSACLLNYAEVTSLIKEEERVRGVVFRDKETDKAYRLKAKCVINATGVYVDAILKMDDKKAKKSIVASQGIHLVVDKSFLSGKHAIMIPRTSDGRVMFAVPWHGKVVIGTTDTAIDIAEIEPKALEKEINFLLKTAAQYLNRKPERKDVLSVFSGLRPLAAPEEEGKKTKSISRGHKINVSLSGLLTIIGGKWTTYRKMAEELIDKAIIIGDLDGAICKTKTLQVHGYMLNADHSDHKYVYGSDLEKLHVLLNEKKEFNEKIHPCLPYLKGEVIWAVRNEMARRVEDVLARRLRALFLDAQCSMEMAETVARLMAVELGLDEEWIQKEVNDYRALAKGYLL